uniref:Uncharacterized protein n=1 Tax=Heterosigma akashiwo TaxID=2829 RepID=A0A6V1QMS6_HETAK
MKTTTKKNAAVRNAPTGADAPPPPAQARMLCGEGGAVVDSEMVPGRRVLVKDDLRLQRDLILLNDRGYDLENGALLYGNARGLPYKMERVSKTKNQDLLWTLPSGRGKKE